MRSHQEEGPGHCSISKSSWSIYNKYCTYKKDFLRATFLFQRKMIENHVFLFPFKVVAANRSGQLTIEVETHEVTITTYFKNVEVEFIEQSAADERPEVVRRDERFEVRIDIQKLNSLLNAQQSMFKRITCSISDGQSLHLVLQTDETTVNYYLPAMIS